MGISFHYVFIFFGGLAALHCLRSWRRRSAIDRIPAQQGDIQIPTAESRDFHSGMERQEDLR
jgi:hypothetical protein